VTTDVIVLGAGTAGVTAARELARARFQVVVVEARDRVGGRVHSVHDFCDQAVEAGAEFVHGTGAATWPEIQAARLAVRPCPLFSKAMFNVGGRTRWLPWIVAHPGVWPTYPILHRLKRLRPPDLSAAEFVTRQGYRGRARVMAEMTLAAHLPGSVDDIGVLGLVEDGVLRLETGLNHRIVEGYDRLPQYMAGNLDVRFGVAVDTLRWAADGVSVRAGDGTTFEARAAVCTLPVGVLQHGGIRFVPALPATKESALDQLVMGPVLKVLVRFGERFWPPWVTTIRLYWPFFHGADDQRPVLIAYCTGPRAARLSGVSEDEAVAVVLDDLRRLFPRTDPRRLYRAHQRIDWATDPFARGGYTFLRPGGSGARARLATPDTGALFWAGSATETAPIAETVEAAYLSGLRAAGEVRSHLER
jgi:monoamine oxidase